jgi:FkbM family methyltransferase
LQKNIELNNLQQKVALNNVGLGREKSRANLKHYSMQNIGATWLQEDKNGDFILISLDEYTESNNFKENKIDFFKIDVEGFEYEVLLGAKDTLLKYKPKIFIETFPDNYNKVDELLEKYGYKMEKAFEWHNYLYVSC